MGTLLIAIGKVLDIALNIYLWIVIISALISWVNPDPYNPIVRFLRQVTEPALRPIRKIIGYRLGPIDVSPIILILFIYFLQFFLVSLLIDIGHKLKGGIGI